MVLRPLSSQPGWAHGPFCGRVGPCAGLTGACSGLRLHLPGSQSPGLIWCQDTGRRTGLPCCGLSSPHPLIGAGAWGLLLGWRRGQPGGGAVNAGRHLVALPVCPDPGTGKVKVMVTGSQGRELLPVLAGLPVPGPGRWDHR